MHTLVQVDKGQALFIGGISSIEEMPSKNPAWDSRWRVRGEAMDGTKVETYVGNKAFSQQLSRRRVTTDALIGMGCIFERTAEGYFNLLFEGEETKPGIQMLLVTVPAPRPAAKAPTPPAHKSPNSFPEEESMPAEAGETPDEARARHRDGRRQEAVASMDWAITMADAMVGAVLEKHGAEWTPDVMRSVVALAATLHISSK